MIEPHQDQFVDFTAIYEVEDSQEKFLQRQNFIHQCHLKWQREMGCDPIHGWKKLEFKTSSEASH